MLDKIEITGLRGFSKRQSLTFAKYNGTIGSGLTMLLGSNNAGKSTIHEAMQAIMQINKHQLPSFTQGRRNTSAGDFVRIRLSDSNGNYSELTSSRTGSSETRVTKKDVPVNNIFVLPSRRAFNPFFGKAIQDRSTYIMNQITFPSQRVNINDQFSYRLFNAEKNIDDFNKVLSKVLNPVPNWTIDQNDNGQYFLKFFKQIASHSSEGLGEGLVSLFFIIDALYDSKPGDIILIDEPELSLHPSLQKKMSSLLSDYAKDRQIVVSTHSPYFISLENLKNGAKIARIHLENESTIISELTTSSSFEINKMLDNSFNPHIFGLNAKEVFFLEDNIILVEGQEDVIFYQKILDQLQIEIGGNFFGWGVGGADNMPKFIEILKELGFKKVVVIFDNDQVSYLDPLRETYPNYNFNIIPAKDVRTKPARKATEKVEGLLDDKNKQIRGELLEETQIIFQDIQSYFNKQ